MIGLFIIYFRFTIGGYPNRGNPIFGIAFSDGYGLDLTLNKVTYTSLHYANGPGFYNLDKVRKENLTEEVTSADNYLQETAVPLDQETHGGEGRFLRLKRSK